MNARCCCSQCPLNGQVGCLQCFPIINSAGVTTVLQPCVHIWMLVSLSQVPRVKISGSKIAHIEDLDNYYQNAFPKKLFQFTSPSVFKCVHFQPEVCLFFSGKFKVGQVTRDSIIYPRKKEDDSQPDSPLQPISPLPATGENI